MVLPNKDRYDKGKEFQEHVKKLLARAGYLEGQLYSTSGEYDEHYYERLKDLGKHSYTSPDITVLNHWDKPEKDLDKRFGIACSRRDTEFNRYSNPAVTFPTYQRYDLIDIQDKMGLPIYIVFGRTIASNFHIGITELREPEEVIHLVDQSTGNNRATDVYYVDELWSWKAFIQHRRDMGDREPNPEKADAPQFPL